MKGAEHQERVTRRYERRSRLYDAYTRPMEWMGGARRRTRLLRRASGSVLEVGAGTGASLPHYPPEVWVVALDIAAGMLERAQGRASRATTPVVLLQGDVHRLPFADDAFDTTVAACVFCSVADPVRGLEELGRVTKPDGRVLLLEHVRPRTPWLGRLFDRLTPLTRRLLGPDINRRTEANAQVAGLGLTDVRRDGIWREIAAQPPSGNRKG